MMETTANRAVAERQDWVPCPGLEGTDCGHSVPPRADGRTPLCYKCSASQLIYKSENLVSGVDSRSFQDAIRTLEEAKQSFNDRNYRVAVSRAHEFFRVFTTTRVGLMLLVPERDLVPRARVLFVEATHALQENPFEALRLVEKMWDIQRTIREREEERSPFACSSQKKGPPPKAIAHKRERSETDKQIRQNMRGGSGGGPTRDKGRKKDRKGRR